MEGRAEMRWLRLVLKIVEIEWVYDLILFRIIFFEINKEMEFELHTFKISFHFKPSNKVPPKNFDPNRFK